MNKFKPEEGQEVWLWDNFTNRPENQKFCGMKFERNKVNRGELFRTEQECLEDHERRVNGCKWTRSHMLNLDDHAVFDTGCYQMVSFGCVMVTPDSMRYGLHCPNCGGRIVMETAE